MNALELADYLDNNVDAMLITEQPYLDQAATMLRQQHAEIEALKEQIAFLEDKAILVDNSLMQYNFQPLFNEEYLEAQNRINNMLRKMVDELNEKDRK